MLVCVVCKDEFVMDVDAKLLPCNHFFSEKRGRQRRDLMEMWCGSSGDGVEGEGINLVEKKNEKKNFGKACVIK